ncbi:hypothetical protein RvY_08946 [Ramazzottius varieornatus]|uniref:NECAP PHear domain-containing protein n=1 Tax=Ramazzottius varieornatus TaxID=947166 RepID=A0A1D1VA71_RAMVA|nr:hypothetical protein RvY_08946 [Ramazzottius varieornatus]
MESYERILLVKPEVFIYKIPPRTTARGYRAADWTLDKPDWTLRLRIIAKDKLCTIRLEDKMSGELFGECPVDSYPGSAVESVTDSSRYFVLRIQDPSGRSAFLGLGYGDRSDSFDMNVCLQDHFKWVTTSESIGKEEADIDNKPKLDLAFKEGQMIKINIGKKSTTTTGQSPSNQPTPGILPPPPSGASSQPRSIRPPPGPPLPVRPQPQHTDLTSKLSGDTPNFPVGESGISGGKSSLPMGPQQGVPPASGEWGNFASSTNMQKDANSSWLNF